MSYTVKAYDNYEVPNPCWMTQGTFETAAEAVALAHRVIRESLERLYQANRKPDAAGLRMAYLCHGEVPAIFSEPEVPFDPYEAVEWHIREITGEMTWGRGESDRSAA